MTTKQAIVLAVCFLGGALLIIGGIYELAGRGWAMVSGGIVFLLVFSVLMRGARE